MSRSGNFEERRNPSAYSKKSRKDTGKLKEQLNLLKKLQETDKKIAEIERERDFFPKEIERIEESLRNEEDAIGEIRDSIAGREKEKREKDAELSDNTEQLSRFRERQRNIKTNAEYQAVLREIDQAKKLNREIEDQILTLMEEIETEQTRLSQAETALAEGRKKAEDEKKSLLSNMDEVEKKLKDALAEREEETKAVDPAIFQLYDTLKSRMKGFALAMANNGTCTGCHMQIPPQLINDAMKFEKIYQCPHCHRILVVEQ